MKNLNKLGRDLSKVIIIDNIEENFQFNKENGIRIKSWFNDLNDSALKDLIPILEELISNTPDDIRL